MRQATDEEIMETLPYIRLKLLAAQRENLTLEILALRQRLYDLDLPLWMRLYRKLKRASGWL